MKVLPSQSIHFVLTRVCVLDSAGSKSMQSTCHLVTDRLHDAIEYASINSNVRNRNSHIIYTWTFLSGVQCSAFFIMGEPDIVLQQSAATYIQTDVQSCIFGVLETLFANGFECLARVETT